MKQMSDDELIRRFTQTNETQFYDEIHRRYAAMLRVYLAARFFPGDDGAEDVVQATFQKLFQEPWRVKNGDQLRPWLFCVARNQAINIKRQGGRRFAHSLSSMSTDRDDVDFDPTDESVEDSATQVERMEQANELRSLLPLLAVEVRAAVDAVYVESRTYRDAAEHLGIPEGTVKTRCRKAFRFLRVRLDQAA